MNKKPALEQRRRWLIIAVVVSLLFSLWFMTRWISDVRRSVSAVELLLLIPLPLIIFYGWSNWTRKEKIANIVFVFITWMLTYSLLHELSHLTGSILVGRRILGYQLIPRFWEGQFFSGAGVASEPTGLLSDKLGFLTALAPYVKDTIFLVAGYFILRPRKIRNSFLAGLLFTLCCLSSLFDVVNNYSIYLLDPDTVGNDFQGAALTIGAVWTNIVGGVFTVSAAAGTLRILTAYRGFPESQGYQKLI